MPLDGTTLAAVASELKDVLLGGRLDKIAQPEPDEIVLSIRAHGANHKLLLSANASSPRVHLTAVTKNSPLQAPMFCMLLRKHISGGRLMDITQPDYERILILHLESPDEMGDRTVKQLVIEIMGKHSNIMLLDHKGTVLDAIKHVSHEVSAVREILPGKSYTRPPSGGKTDPLYAEADSFAALLGREDKATLRIQQGLYQSYNGISPVMASEICLRAGVAPDIQVGALDDAMRSRLFFQFTEMFDAIRHGRFDCRIYFDETGKPADCAALALTLFTGKPSQTYASPSEMLEAFYRRRDTDYRLAQKTADLRKLVSGQIERCVKKQWMYDKTLADIKDRDRFRIYGELLTAYIYAIEKGAKSFTAENFYENGAEICIPLDEALTPAENAQAYFKQYNKQKRTFAALQTQIKQNTEDLAYLDSVSAGLQTVTEENDIADIRAELSGQGFLKKTRAKGFARSAQAAKKSKPLHYVSSDGFDIYVGKNNTQNDELTLRLAQNGDIWLHTKDIAGSHVIIKTHNSPPPERTLHEAVHLAAFYSKGRGSSQVPVDYALKKYVRKPNGAKPGFVIYDHHKTAYVTPDEHIARRLTRTTDDTTPPPRI